MLLVLFLAVLYLCMFFVLFVVELGVLVDCFAAVCCLLLFCSLCLMCVVLVAVCCLLFVVVACCLLLIVCACCKACSCTLFALLALLHAQCMHSVY